jgi:hypothetical protein
MSNVNRFFVLASVVLLLAANSIAQDLNQSPNEFTALLDGNETERWAGDLESYEFNAGVVKCKPNTGGTIYYNREVSDFVLRMEFKLPPGGNNGLAIRYPGKGDTAYVGMCELQVLDSDHKKYANLDPRQHHGSAYGMVAALRGHLRPAGQWNFQEVTVKGSTVKVELNGTVILDCDLSTVEEFLDDKPHPGITRKKGYFGFAGHGDPVEFRKVELKEL